MAVHILTSPFDRDFSDIKIGDRILLNGNIYTGRDAAHKIFYDMLLNGEELPISIKNQAIYYTGPCPASPNHVIGPCGPTTSGRMDKFTPLLLDRGLKIMIGKGQRSRDVIESMIKNKCIYLSATGGAGALLSKCVKKSEIAAFPQLGTEAVRLLYVVNFPAIVSIDIYGNNLYEEGIKNFRI